MSDHHAERGDPNISSGESVVIERLMNLRQHQQDGKRSPHKPLLALLALARIDTVGSSAIPWAEAPRAVGESPDRVRAHIHRECGAVGGVPLHSVAL